LALAELWERESVSAVQIMMAEDFGVEGRGRSYDLVGALRELVLNHLLQVLALVAMDPPVGGTAYDMQDKKAEVFRAMPPADPQHYLRGQCQGYADTPGVARGSATETYVCAAVGDRQLALGGCPHLPAGRQGAAAHGHRGAAAPAPNAPACLPAPADQSRAQPGRAADRPGAGLRLQLSALTEQSWRPVHLDTPFVRELGEPAEPHERSPSLAVAEAARRWLSPWYAA
jgi:glucose-6-phosphate 1-dehydrogenase